jgi:hypothetical protein
MGSWLSPPLFFVSLKGLSHAPFGSRDLSTHERERARAHTHDTVRCE